MKKLTLLLFALALSSVALTVNATAFDPLQSVLWTMSKDVVTSRLEISSVV